MNAQKKFSIAIVFLLFFSCTTYAQLLTVKNLTGFSDLLVQPYYQNPAPLDKIIFENIPKGYIITEMVTKLSVKPPNFRSYRITLSNAKSPDNEKFVFISEENVGGYRKLITLVFATQNFETYKKWYDELNASNDITRSSPLINAVLYQYKRKAISLSLEYTSKVDTRDLTIDTVTANTPITYTMSIQYPDNTALVAPSKEFLEMFRKKK